MNLVSDTLLGITASMGKAIEGFGKAFTYTIDIYKILIPKYNN